MKYLKKFAVCVVAAYLLLPLLGGLTAVVASLYRAWGQRDGYLAAASVLFGLAVVGAYLAAITGYRLVTRGTQVH